MTGKKNNPKKQKAKRKAKGWRFHVVRVMLFMSVIMMLFGTVIAYL